MPEAEARTTGGASSSFGSRLLKRGEDDVAGDWASFNGPRGAFIEDHGGNGPWCVGRGEGHEQDVLVESVDGGQTWTRISVNGAMSVGNGTMTTLELSPYLDRCYQYSGHGNE